MTCAKCFMTKKATSFVKITTLLNLLRTVLGVNTEDVALFSMPRSCLPIDKPDAVATIVYEDLQAPNIIPTDEEGWGIQVGHEGFRLDLKGQNGPLARWRINLRGRYSYLMLLHNPDTFSRIVLK